MPVYSQSEEDDPAKHFDEVGKQYTYSVLIIILLKTKHRAQEMVESIEEGFI